MNDEQDYIEPRRNYSTLIVSVFGVFILGCLIYYANWGMDPEKKSRPRKDRTDASHSVSSPMSGAMPNIEKNLLPVSSKRMAEVPDVQPRLPVDTSGYQMTIPSDPWPDNASLEVIRTAWVQHHDRLQQELQLRLKQTANDPVTRVAVMAAIASLEMADGEAEKAYKTTTDLRAAIDKLPLEGQQKMLGSAVFFQGVSALRLGENENCVICRGDSACIFPIKESAVHKNTRGSARAIEHFTEYLEVYPNDLEVKWLLNLAHMTLGQYPDKVNPKYLLTLEAFEHPGESLGPFKDVAEAAGINRFDQAGGAILEDLDGDGWLDLVETTWDVKTAMSIYQNKGDGTFKDRTKDANVADQYSGLHCMQTDYNNDGKMDIFIPRGAWLPYPVRPSLLRNDGDFKFTDVTDEAGLLESVNSNSAQWADYDHDGWLDLFVCCEKQQHRLYHNLGNGKFAEVTRASGIVSPREKMFGKGSCWTDYNNDRYPDLFINYLDGAPNLYRNNMDGTFTDVAADMGIDGPTIGFSCWSWDYNNDGWLDIFATCYQRTLGDIVKGIEGKPHALENNRLYLNQGGKSFKDVTAEVGLDSVYAAMGSNFGDLDNDGYQDFYLATGEPELSTLVPNRMFRNVNAERFVEVTKSAGVGHLQKGHSVSFHDYDRDNDMDIFVQVGGAIDGDKFRNIMFQNPGNQNSSFTVKLVGDKTNRAAIGARIKVITEASEPLTVHRVVSSGSSFGASPLEQTIGIGNAKRVAKLEVYWPTSDSTQVFENIDAGSYVIVKEFAKDFETKTFDRKAGNAVVTN